jgi:hypothetical protein
LKHPKLAEARLRWAVAPAFPFMNTSRPSIDLSSRRPRFVVRAVSAALLLCLPLGLGGCFSLSSDAEALRDAAQKAVAPAGPWDEHIEIGVGAVSLSLVRSIVACSDVDPQARQILAAARSAEVGVYELCADASSRAPAELIAATTAAMNARGWDRVVAVIDEHDTVAVFVPREIEPDEPLKMSVVVFDGTELVVASVRADLERIVTVALGEMRRNRGEI